MNSKPYKLVSVEEELRVLGGCAPFFSFLAPLLERLLAIHSLNRIYAEVRQRLVDLEQDPAFFMKTLQVMGTSVEIDQQSFERIPRTGPLIVIANHPFGGIDGVSLGALLSMVRPDSRLLGNFLLSRMDGIRGNIIKVDPFQREGSAQANFAGMREAIRWLKRGACLGVFPSGEVSSFHFRSLSVADPVWSSHIVSLAMRTKATILPLYFEGNNGLLFHLAGLVHPSLRTLLLPREFSKMEKKTLRIRIGRPLSPELLSLMGDHPVTTDYLRLQTYALAKSAPGKIPLRQIKLPFWATQTGKDLSKTAPPQKKEVMSAEIAGLPASAQLLVHGNFEVYCADAVEIPFCLQEIGRLREETFRMVGEGTGESIDLDEFDAYYKHLFVWDARLLQVVGAYRIGVVDTIVQELGTGGLYTATLFKFRKGFLEKLGNSLELGRSFISVEYQKKHASLALLWRGIGAFLIQNPRYKTLFGPVSITNSYDRVSKDLMVHYLREHSLDEELSSFVQARKPPKAKENICGISLSEMGKSLHSVGAVSAVVSGIEEDNKGIPVLLRHYLKLNGHLLSFNVDTDFSNVIDGLILVDLTKAEPKMLQRYMGKQGYSAFMQFHSNKSSPTYTESVESVDSVDPVESVELG